MAYGHWVNGEYIRLWERQAAAGQLIEHDDEPRHRWPVQYSELRSDAVLFIGLNPAFNRKWLTSHSDFSPDDFRWEESGPSADKSRVLRREHSWAVGREGQPAYRYFQPLNKMASSADWTWEHIDLFPVRETIQNKLRSKLKIANDGSLESDFAKDCYAISKRLINDLNPRVVVVINALASRVVRCQHQVSEDWQLSSGYVSEGFHRLSFGGNEIPTLFSGMLSGQRSLDLASRERLSWLIARAL